MRGAFLVQIVSLALGSLAYDTNGQVVVGPTGVVDVLSKDLSRDKVFIGCDPNAPIGAVTDVVTGRTTHIVANQPLDSLFVALLGGDTTHNNGLTNLFLKVNRVRLDVVGRHPFCLLHAEVIRKEEGGHKRVFERAVAVDGDIGEYRKEGFGGALRHALQAYLNAFTKALQQWQLVLVDVPEHALSKPMLLDTGNAPILYDSTLRKGLYRTFAQMRLNEPGTTFTLDHRRFGNLRGLENVVRLNDPSLEESRSWGFCDGHAPYIRLGGFHVKLERTANGFIGAIPVFQSTTYTPIFIGGGLLGSLIGTAILAGVTAALPPTIIGSAQYELDMTSGDFFPFYANGMNSTYGAVIFYFDRYSKGTEPISIRLGDEPEVTLTKGRWTMFLPTPSASAMPIRLSTTSKSVDLSINTNSDLTKTYLVGISKQGELKADKLNINMEEKIFKQLDAENQVP